MLSGREVAVVGAGIGGLAAALALARRGARVCVFERAPQLSEVGAGLQISPNGVAVLDALGLGEELRRLGPPVEAIELRDYRRGALVARLPLPAQGRPFLPVHRADLLELLASAARAAGVEILPGQELRGLEADPEERPGRLRLDLAGGARERVGLLVGADGLHSRVRPFLNGAAEAGFTGQVAWRAIVPAPRGIAPRVEVHMAPGRHVVFYPLRGGRLINIVAVEERAAWHAEGWNHPGDPAVLREAFSAFGGDVRALLVRVDRVMVWGLFRHPVARRWHGRGCVLLGDAAHPTLPFLAQGANMALEDAWVLADCLAKMPQDRALAAYQGRRRDRVLRVVAAADANARNYHLRNPALRLAAHGALRALSRLFPGHLPARYRWIHAHDVTREG